MRFRFLSLLLLCTAGLALAADDGPGPERSTVVSVYDGDTFTLATGDKIRLAWVNAPELKPAEDYGPEARDATQSFLGGKEVTLVYGPTLRDGYGRLLADVYVDGRELPIHLLEQGLAHVFVVPPAAGDVTPYLAAQEKARAANRGIWSTERYKGDLHITSFHANAPGDDTANVNGEYLRACNVSSRALDLQGYRITDLSGRSWTFPELVVPAGYSFKIHSGQGETQSDPNDTLAIYLGNAGPIWNNDRDRATIYDRYGKVVDTRKHEVKGK